MKTNGKKLTALLGVAVLVMGILAGCGSTTAEAIAAGIVTPVTTAEMTAETSAMVRETGDQAAIEVKNAPSVDLSGAINTVGSISMEKSASVFSGSFAEKYLNVAVTAGSVGSGARIEAVSNGIADIGNPSRGLKGGEKAGGVTESIVAIDGIAVVADGADTVKDPTRQQLPNIYEGKITNWKDVGGNDAPIVVTGHESGSDARSILEEPLKLEDMCKYSSELDSTDAVVVKVASTPGTTGYVPLDVLDDTVRAIKLGDAESAEENIKAGSYFLSCPFVMITKGDMSEQSELVKALFDYIYSDEGAEIAKPVGLIAVDK